MRLGHQDSCPALWKPWRGKCDCGTEVSPERKKTTYNTLPMVECPHCGKESQWDDYYDLSAGCHRECVHCEKEIHVVDVDTVTTAWVTTEPDT